MDAANNNKSHVHSIDQTITTPTANKYDKLTPRQIDVLKLIIYGMSNKEIARVLLIAEPTVKIHVAALVRTMRVRNRTEASFKAAEFLKSACQRGS